MKKARKILTMALCAVLLVCISVGATIAYLTSNDTVTNTFTVGKVEITLDEADVNPDGTIIADAARVKENDYKLFPNRQYTKDPIVHVDDESETCWLFVEITNEIAAIEDQTNTIADQMAAKGWAVMDETRWPNTYAYRAIVSAGADVPVFDTFKIAGTVDNTVLAAYGGKQVIVKAYAVQSDGFTSAAAAWEAAYDEMHP